ncbi:hypothetical protein FN846DRAFT_467515 [Sphaerosporella brunnea]|uniref:Uncharacterized protein n=1 Tax=Sphaerosporella brunnea TaxID=1250544 RepID=A0A5J5F468_9PEZI|nr:hypothetical protein FN846DRAFT_467515 [Sphaerosporella brunnea]
MLPAPHTPFRLDGNHLRSTSEAVCAGQSAFLMCLSLSSSLSATASFAAGAAGWKPLSPYRWWSYKSQADSHACKTSIGQIFACRLAAVVCASGFRFSFYRVGFFYNPLRMEGQQSLAGMNKEAQPAVQSAGLLGAATTVSQRYLQLVGPGRYSPPPPAVIHGGRRKSNGTIKVIFLRFPSSCL